MGYPVVVDARAVHFFVMASEFYFHQSSGEHRVLCIGNLPSPDYKHDPVCGGIYAVCGGIFAPTSLYGVAPSFVIAARVGPIVDVFLCTCRANGDLFARLGLCCAPPHTTHTFDS